MLHQHRLLSFWVVQSLQRKEPLRFDIVLTNTVATPSLLHQVLFRLLQQVPACLQASCMCMCVSYSHGDMIWPAALQPSKARPASGFGAVQLPCSGRLLCRPTSSVSDAHVLAMSTRELRSSCDGRLWSACPKCDCWCCIILCVLVCCSAVYVSLHTSGISHLVYLVTLITLWSLNGCYAGAQAVAYEASCIFRDRLVGPDAVAKFDSVLSTVWRNHWRAVLEPSTKGLFVTLGAPAAATAKGAPACSGVT